MEFDSESPSFDSTMSEYWVSKKKYFCKYCDIYIADDAPSRQHHENGLRHKGNVERFIRGIYKSGEKQKKDLEEEKREMRRVEQAAAVAFAGDVGAGLAKPSAPVASTSTAPKKPAPKPSNPYANYSTAESLGYTDPDAERIAAELEARRSQGIAGEWQVVETIQPPTGSAATEDALGTSEQSQLNLNETGVKREAEGPLDDDDDSRAFKLRKKTLSRGLGEIYDPGMIAVKIKKKEEPDVPQPIPGSSNPQLAPVTDDPAGGALKWKTTQWKRAVNGETTENVKVEEASSTSDTPNSSSKWAKPQWSEPLPDFKPVKREDMFENQEEVKADKAGLQSEQIDVKLESDITEEPQSVKISEEAPATGLFKKRKVPTGAGKGRRGA